MAQEDVDVQQQKKGFSAKARDFGRSIWNGQKKEFIGRTAGSWAKIGLFYMIFYSCLAGFFAVMLVGFFSTLDNTAPTQQDMYSLIKSNPGMGFRPMINVESTLIKFSADDPASYAEHIENLKQNLHDHQVIVAEANYTTCENGEQPNAHEVCKFNVTDLGSECTEANSFGYANGTPCVLLKINKVYNWTPNTFNCNITEADETSDIAKEGKRKLGNRCEDNHVGITCEGEGDSDLDSLLEIEYFPSGGFSSSYYPYKNAKGYQSPLVFVRFKEVKYGSLIQVWCKLWAYNIKHHKNDKAGSVHFELLVDKKP